MTRLAAVLAVLAVLLVWFLLVLTLAEPVRHSSARPNVQMFLTFPRPTPSRASRSRHVEPPSRLDLLDWHALAECESSNDPHAVSPGGSYRGLYQFDTQTWASVGGHGDPSRAPAWEQTRRAQLLYGARGREPWPSCGRRL